MRKILRRFIEYWYDTSRFRSGAVRLALCIVMGVGGGAVAAEPVPQPVIAHMAAADVVLLGEVHDNPGHHARQAAAVMALRPKAVVWEMLTPQAAAGIDPAWLSQPDKLESALKWDETGWPPFAMYAPIFAAAPQARMYGANLPRGAARQASKDVVGYFGAEAGRYGLDQPLSDERQAEREAFQGAAHCDALPDAMLPVMVDLQRLRDALLARAVVTAMQETGGPVAVITGNGHARRDRGIAGYLASAAPGMKVYALGQSEAGQIEGVYDAVLDSPAVDRPDPCLAFRTQD